MDTVMGKLLKEERAEVTNKAIRNMIDLGLSKDKILTKYTVEEYETALKSQKLNSEQKEIRGRLAPDSFHLLTTLIYTKYFPFICRLYSKRIHHPISAAFFYFIFIGDA